MKVPVSLTFSPSLCLSSCLPVWLPAWLSNLISIYRSVCLSGLSASFCLSVCLSVYLLFLEFPLLPDLLLVELFNKERKEKILGLSHPLLLDFRYSWIRYSEIQLYKFGTNTTTM